MITDHVYKTEAIVLARKNVGEADRILTLFTKEYGKLRVLAKGIRKVTSRRSPHAEVFSMTLMLLHRGKTNLDIVGEITPLETFQYLRKHLNRVILAYYLCELVERLLPEKQEHRDVYTLLAQNLKKMNEENIDNPDQLNNKFALELLRILGFMSKDKILPPADTDHYIESIIERRLRTPKIIRQLA